MNSKRSNDILVISHSKRGAWRRCAGIFTVLAVLPLALHAANPPAQPQVMVEGRMIQAVASDCAVAEEEYAAEGFAGDFVDGMSGHPNAGPICTSGQFVRVYFQTFDGLHVKEVGVVDPAVQGKLLPENGLGQTYYAERTVTLVTRAGDVCPGRGYAVQVDGEAWYCAADVKPVLDLPAPPRAAAGHLRAQREYHSVHAIRRGPGL